MPGRGREEGKGKGRGEGSGVCAVEGRLPRSPNRRYNGAADAQLQTPHAHDAQKWATPPQYIGLRVPRNTWSQARGVACTLARSRPPDHHAHGSLHAPLPSMTTAGTWQRANNKKRCSQRPAAREAAMRQSRKTRGAGADAT